MSSIESHDDPPTQEEIAAIRQRYNDRFFTLLADVLINPPFTDNPPYD